PTTDSILNTTTWAATGGSSGCPDQSPQRSAYLFELALHLFGKVGGDVLESCPDVHAVADFDQRRASDPQEVQSSTAFLVRKALDDIGSHRECGATNLTAQFEPFAGWKRFVGDAMKLDEQVVRALPGNQRMVRKRHL